MSDISGVYTNHGDVCYWSLWNVVKVKEACIRLHNFCLDRNVPFSDSDAITDSEDQGNFNCQISPSRGGSDRWQSLINMFRWFLFIFTMSWIKLLMNTITCTYWIYWSNWIKLYLWAFGLIIFHSTSSINLLMDLDKFNILFITYPQINS